MDSSIIKIGNSRGVRLPKAMLEQSGIDKNVKISVVNGEIHIVASEPEHKVKISETMLLSQKALAKDWLRPEEDEAWKHLQ